MICCDILEFNIPTYWWRVRFHILQLIGTFVAKLLSIWEVLFSSKVTRVIIENRDKTDLVLLSAVIEIIYLLIDLFESYIYFYSLIFPNYAHLVFENKFLFYVTISVFMSSSGIEVTSTYVSLHDSGTFVTKKTIII